jgi:hypothetical protein
VLGAGAAGEVSAGSLAATGHSLAFSFSPPRSSAGTFVFSATSPDAEFGTGAAGSSRDQEEHSGHHGQQEVLAPAWLTEGGALLSSSSNSSRRRGGSGAGRSKQRAERMGASACKRAGAGGRARGGVLAKANGSSSDGKNGDGSTGMCVVCISAKSNTACVPCGHKCLCQGCSQIILGIEGARQQQMVCPLCREEVMMAIQVYE